jgi:3-oxoacyl-[acyl-carrier protein] reductase
MDLGIAGLNAVVLGGSSGLGLGIATALAQEKAHVTISSSTAAKLEAGVAHIKTAAGASAKTVVCDLHDAASVAKFLAAAPSADILVLNGGGPPPGSVQAVTEETWLKQFRSLFLSHTMIANAYLPAMKHKKFGRIILVISSGVQQPIPNLGISNALRGSLVGWAKTLAREVASDGITVNCVAPGRVRTPRLTGVDAARAKAENVGVDVIEKRSLTEIPMGRFGTIEEFGAAAAFLASKQASYTTGSIVRVDGGLISSL